MKHRGHREHRDRRHELNALTHEIIGAAIKVHDELGPGLLESTYEACLEFELTRRGHSVDRQREQPVIYDGLKIECGYRLDLLVDDAVILEVKAVSRILPIHQQQLLTYLRLSDRLVGLLVNFNVMRLVEGVSRVMNGYPNSVPSVSSVLDHPSG